MTSLQAAELEALIEDRLLFERASRAARRLVDAEERPPVTMPEALSLKERLARPQDPVAWRVEGWLPAGGRVVMAAQAKAGKTTAAANVVRSLVDGVPFLGRDAVTPVVGKVAVLDFEMTERQLDRWYAALGIQADDRVLLLPLRGRAAAFDLRDEGLRGQWAALLLEHQVELVVWDCLRPVVDALGLDENHDASALLTAFDALLTEAGNPEAVVIHHMGHNSERARGDSGILGWPDANWKLVLNEGDERGPRWLSAYGRDVDQVETQLARDPATNRLIVAGGTRASARRSAAMDAIVRWLGEAEEPLNKRQIEALADSQGVPRAAVRESLTALIAVNQVVVEQGEKRALLHRLNPQFASSPVCADSPPAHQLASVPPPYRAARGEHMEMSEEQRAILEQIGGQS